MGTSCPTVAPSKGSCRVPTALLTPHFQCMSGFTGLASPLYLRLSANCVAQLFRIGEAPRDARLLAKLAARAHSYTRGCSLVTVTQSTARASFARARQAATFPARAVCWGCPEMAAWQARPESDSWSALFTMGAVKLARQQAIRSARGYRRRL